MICIEARKLIQLYLDSELGARDTLDVQQHLATCSACSALLDWFLRQDELLRESARAEAADATDQIHVRELILTKIRTQSGSGSRRWLRALEAAAAVLMAVAVAGILLRSGFLTSHESLVYAAVVADHVDHCTLDKLAAAETDRTKLNRLVAEYSGLKTVPDLSAFGYGIPRGEVCAVNGAPVLHLIYYDSRQQPLSLFLRPHRSDLETDRLTVEKRDRYRVSSVSAAGIDVFVVAVAGEDQAGAVVLFIAAQL